MASWVLASTPSSLTYISRLIPRSTLLARHARLFPHIVNKTFASVLSVSASVDPSDMTPSMETMLKQPPRTSGWDRSLFEEVTDEYTQATTDVDSAAEYRKPCNALLELVDAGDFVAATRVKEELEKLGVAIQPHPRYISAAIYALSSAGRSRKPDLSMSSLSSFDDWATLVPIPDALYDYPFLRSKVFTKLPRRIAATLLHAVVAARMGYSSKIALQVVPWAMRWTNVAAGRGFMQAFADADLHFRMARRSHTKSSWENGKHFKSWYALAVRTRCISNDTKSACALLRDAFERGLDAPVFTLKMLLRKVRENHDVENIPWVTEKYLLLKEKETASLDALSVNSRYLLYYQMRKVLMRGRTPTRRRLYAFIRQCIESGDVKLFHHILKDVHKHSDYSRATRQWASAEISYYFDNHKDLAALYIFRQYFRPAGIPKAMIVMLNQLDFDGLPKYLTSRIIPQPAAAWPTAETTLLMWQLYFKALRQDQIKYAYLEFESLYDAHVLLKSSHSSAPPETVRQALILTKQGRVPPVDVPNPLGLDHFRQFLHTISKYNDTKLLVHVIQKMRSLGWHPRDGDLSAITDCFARGGSAEHLIPVLDELRADYAKHSAARTSQSAAAGQAEEARTSTPRPPATAMYRVAIKSMISVSRYATAGKLARYLHRRVGYRKGASEKTDRILNKVVRELNRVSTDVVCSGELTMNAHR